MEMLTFDWGEGFWHYWVTSGPVKQRRSFRMMSHTDTETAIAYKLSHMSFLSCWCRTNLTVAHSEVKSVFLCSCCRTSVVFLCLPYWVNKANTLSFESEPFSFRDWREPVAVRLSIYMSQSSQQAKSANEFDSRNPRLDYCLLNGWNEVFFEQ